MKRYRTISLAVICILAVLHNGNSATIEDLISLRTTLFQNYTTDFRPMRNQSAVLKVNLGFTLEGITEVNVRNQILGCNVVFMLDWHDEFLRWNPKEYGDTESMNPSIDQIWHLKLMVTNSLGSRELVPGENHPLRVTHGGYVTWLPAAVLQTSCRLDMTWFPFDAQTCHVRIMSIRYYTSEVLIVPNNDKVVKVDKVFLVLNIIVPMVVISFLNMAVFAVPCDTGEKLSSAITVFLSLSVFMTYVSDQMPQTSSPLSVLTIYLTFILLTSALTVLTTIWTLKIHYTSTSTVPAWLRWMTKMNSSNMKRSKVDASEMESAPLECHVTWKDVSRGLDYIFLRMFIVVMTITTTAFIAKLMVANNW